jgi:hypothetical protein
MCHIFSRPMERKTPSDNAFRTLIRPESKGKDFGYPIRLLTVRLKYCMWRPCPIVPPLLVRSRHPLEPLKCLRNIVPVEAEGSQGRNNVSLINNRLAVFKRWNMRRGGHVFMRQSGPPPRHRTLRFPNSFPRKATKPITPTISSGYGSDVLYDNIAAIEDAPLEVARPPATLRKPLKPAT